MRRVVGEWATSWQCRVHKRRVAEGNRIEGKGIADPRHTVTSEVQQSINGGDRTLDLERVKLAS